MSDPAPARISPSRFYGWKIVAVAFLADFIGVGFFFYSYGVFFKALAADLDGSRLGVSIGLALVNLMGALTAPFIGRAIDRYPVRNIMVAGAVATAAGFALSSQVGSLWHYYVILGTLTAVGTSCMGNISSAKLVTNWFIARRGRAMGIATIGISLSGVAMPLIATWLIAHSGWRTAFLIYAVGTLVIVIPPVLRFVHNRPEDLGLLPDGDSPPEPGFPARAEERTWSSGEIFRNANFWAISFAFSLVIASMSAILTHLVPYATDLGIAPYRAASVLSLGALLGAVGKIFFGWLFDRMSPRIAVWVCFGTQLMAVQLLITAHSYPTLLAAALLFGFGMGGIIPLSGSLIGMVFGRLSYGKVMGLMRPVQVPIIFVGAPLAGWIYDDSGSYELAFQIFAVAYVLAIFGTGAIRIQRTAPA